MLATPCISAWLAQGNRFIMHGCFKLHLSVISPYCPLFFHRLVTWSPTACALWHTTLAHYQHPYLPHRNLPASPSVLQGPRPTPPPTCEASKVGKKSTVSLSRSARSASSLSARRRHSVYLSVSASPVWIHMHVHAGHTGVKIYVKHIPAVSVNICGPNAAYLMAAAGSSSSDPKLPWPEICGGGGWRWGGQKA